MSLANSKAGSKSDQKATSAATTSTTTPTKSAIKQLPGKLAKKVKHQFRRLDGVLHHVIHPRVRIRTFSVTSPSSPIFYPIGVVRPFPPPDQSSTTGSVHSRDTWDVSYAKEADTSIEPPDSLANQSIDLSVSVADSSTTHINMSDEHYLPQEEPQLNLHEQDTSASNPTVTSPIEPETPDPFLIDDDEEDSEEEADEEKPSSDTNSSQVVSPTQAVLLDLPSSPEASIPQPQVPLSNLQKDIPPHSESEEEYVPDLYVPALIVPTMFLPIPNTDPLTTLLNKYIYPPEKRPARDVTGEWQRNDFHTLVMTNSWRALARMARDRLVTSDPADLTLILGLWHLRLSCLARLRLFNQTSAECTNLFTVLNAIDPPDTREYVFERLVPFELEVMQTRLRYWAGDQMGYLDVLNALLKKCRTKCRQSGNDPTLVPMWKERGARVCLIIASQLVEMKEIIAAAKLLEPLCKQGDVSNPALRSSVGRIYLQGGIIHTATKHFSLVAADPNATEDMKQMNAALLASAEGNWTEASDNLKAILEKDSDNYVAVNNLSVALLSQGKLKEGIDVLEKSLKASPSSLVVVEPFLFNLSTLYELRSTNGFEKKKELLVEVAKWSGDGLKTHCLKMPAN